MSDLMFVSVDTYFWISTRCLSDLMFVWLGVCLTRCLSDLMFVWLDVCPLLDVCLTRCLSAHQKNWFRFCQSQTFNDWKCDFATKDLSKFRNDNATKKFWRKTIECPTLPLSYDHDWISLSYLRKKVFQSYNLAWS